jgi:dihydroorotase-like cyclic amidohydrolase
MAVLIRGGTIVNHDSTLRADVLVDGGAIVAVGTRIDVPAGAEVIDAGGCYVLPGGIDPHTHLELQFMGTVTADDFEWGTKAALSGGTTMVVDFCIPSPGHSLLAAYQDWRRKAERAACDYGFHMIPNGTGGLEDRLAVLWTAGVNTGRITKEEFVAVTSANSARILNVFPRKGAVAVGSDADLVVWDPEATKRISAKTQVSRIDYNVFEGFDCRGLPRATLSRGRVGWIDGDLRAEAGTGDYVPRAPFPSVHLANTTWRETTAPHRVERVDVTP